MKTPNKWKTRRQKLLEILEFEEEIFDLHSLMRELEYNSKKAFIKDIEHIALSLRNEEKQILVKPSECRACGFVFPQKGYSLNIPSKCPECKEERIKWPSLKLKQN
ncbi:MAG: transcriptional regulator [Candidatus Lokiarchaeota archaeon]|nr:transcriptional regulator [Candidatus Lokiarchaeota archaeon]MBD3200565.1 transcriptional regulator [Candidatus Lokiarchaeota archaeon]